MLIPAKCEKAVTIPERIGRPQEGRVVPAGWKAPRYAVLSAAGNSFPSISEMSHFTGQFAFYPVFSGLQAQAAPSLKRLSGSSHHLTNGNEIATRGGRFGPNFVNIQPTGVCVCSF
jgi:hypothetical protein